MLHLLLLLLLLLLLSFCSYAAVITHLPGLDGPLPFYLETGYVNVEEVNGVELFYYFIESEGNPREDPVLLWLTGGPGCSAFSGLVFENIGPLTFRVEEYNGSLPSLIYNPASWTKAFSIIFLDSPVGSGFSFAKHSQGYLVGDITSSKQVHKFLLKWFADHPQFLSNNFYIAGDSYVGKVLPIVIEDISAGIESGYQPTLNLKGYLVGNPVTGDEIDYNTKFSFLHGEGVISDELYESATINCKGQDYRSPKTTECANIIDVVKKFISEIDQTYILDPHCIKDIDGLKSRLANVDYDELQLPPAVPEIWCRYYSYYLSYFWANSNIVREALHIVKGTVKEWQRCNRDILPYTKDVPNSIPYHRSVITKGYRALIYSGDHDPAIPFLGTHAWIRSFNFSIVDDWRSWRVDGQIAGYTITYANNLTFATVKNAGHTAPEYRPKQCFAMARRWISNEPL